MLNTKEALFPWYAEAVLLG